MKTPINNALAQSDLDFANFKPVRANLADYAGSGLIWNTSTKQLESVGTGGTGDAVGVSVNVKEAPYNAAGNGVTDDTTAIQNAINDVFTAGGGTVCFPGGTYLCNGAFDATTNSILKFPYTDLDHPLAIELRGPVGTTSLLNGGPNAATIKSTRAGTGTYPAILAGNAYNGIGIVSTNLFNAVSVYVRNLIFHADASGLSGVRLDGVLWAYVADVVSVSGTSSLSGPPPSAGTVGVWMPNSGEGVLTCCDRVMSASFDIGYRFGEHFYAPRVTAAGCNCGFEFVDANEGSKANLQCLWSPICVRFVGNHHVELFIDTEVGAPGNWYEPTDEISDVNNWGRGLIKYTKVVQNVGPTTDPMSTLGATGLVLFNLNDPVFLGRGTVPPGGTTGQSLKKLSNTDYDVGWG